MNFTYAYKTMDRTNSEVSHQSDQVFGTSMDTRPADWLDLRLAYDHTITDIGDYNYQVYLDSGQDLNEFPSLRKYNQADVNKDRVRLTGTVYPTDATALTGNLTYGRDDFTNSPYGLTEDNYFAAGLDADWSLSKRLQLHGFYNYEKYMNKQHAQGYFDGTGDGIETLTDWRAQGTDVVHTLGYENRLCNYSRTFSAQSFLCLFRSGRGA